MKLNTRIARRTVWLACGAIVLLTATACGSKLPVVAGTVTLDGKPLPKANVIFLPKDETQSPAQGTTDIGGKYTLAQESGTAGVQVGEYSVRITTYQPGSQDADPPIPAITEVVPVKYNLKTELKASVVANRSATDEPFDFPLTSGGAIFQPAPESF